MSAGSGRARALLLAPDAARARASPTSGSKCMSGHDAHGDGGEAAWREVAEPLSRSGRRSTTAPRGHAGTREPDATNARLVAPAATRARVTTATSGANCASGRDGQGAAPAPWRGSHHPPDGIYASGAASQSSFQIR
jgi:hypothetical protein